MQAYHGVIACGVGPSDVAGRPAFANSVTLGVGPRILQARRRTNNSWPERLAKPGQLSQSELDQARLHPYHTELSRRGIEVAA